MNKKMKKISFILGGIIIGAVLAGAVAYKKTAVLPVPTKPVDDCVTKECLQTKTKDEVNKMLIQKTSEMNSMLPWIAFDRTMKDYGIPMTGANANLKKTVDFNTETANKGFTNNLRILADTQDKSSMIDAIILINSFIEQAKDKAVSERYALLLSYSKDAKRFERLKWFMGTVKDEETFEKVKKCLE